MLANLSSILVSDWKISPHVSSSARPGSVTCMRLPICSSSGTPAVSVNFLIWTETVGWAM
jgi:hypothetical protein